MNNAEIFNIVSIVLFGLSAAFLVTAVILFFVLKINVVIGYLSGRTARKSVEQMRENNEKGPVKNYGSGFSSTNRVKVSTASAGKAGKNGVQGSRKSAETSVHSGPGSEATIILKEGSGGIGSEATDVLKEGHGGIGSEATDVLDEGPDGIGSDVTAILNENSGGIGSEGTEVLSGAQRPFYNAPAPQSPDEEEGTSVLSNSAVMPPSAMNRGVKLEMLDEVIIVHTQERI